MSEILLTAILEKLNHIDKHQQSILAGQEGLKELFDSKLLSENTCAVQALNRDLKSLHIPEEVKISKQITHINGGVRFVLITLISAILGFGSFSMYCYTKYTDYKRFAKSYEAYEENRKWNLGFFEYMKAKNPRDTEKYRNEHPYPVSR